MEKNYFDLDVTCKTFLDSEDEDDIEMINDCIENEAKIGNKVVEVVRKGGYVIFYFAPAWK